MSVTEQPIPPIRLPVPPVRLLAVACAAAAASGLILLPELALGLRIFAATLALCILLLMLSHLLQRQAERAALDAVVDLARGEAEPCFLVDEGGAILWRNTAAEAGRPGAPPRNLPDLLREMFANPAALVHRLQAKVGAEGSAREEVITRRGHVQIQVRSAPGGRYLWRIEDLAQKPGGGRGTDHLSLPMLTAGPSGTVLYMNEAFRRLLGGRVRTLDRIFRDLPILSGRIHRVEAETGPVESLVAELRGPGGRREIYLLPSDAAPHGVAGTSDWDTIEELPVPLLKIMPDGRILASNRPARMLMDHDLAEGTQVTDLLEGLGRPVSDWIAEMADGRGLGRPEILRRAGTRAETYVQVSLTAVHAEEGTHLVAVLHDSTEHKSLEMQFVQSQKMQAIGQLAGGVAHDFNNLLTAISGHCDLLLMRHDSGDNDYADLKQISQNTNRAAALVGQLLAYSRKQNLQPEVLDLRETLSDLAHMLNRLLGEKVTLGLDHDPVMPPIRADKRQMEQAVMNLVVNSRDAMLDGGEITIATECVKLIDPLERDRATVPAGDWAVIRVRDTGPGIDADIRDKIFEPFFTTKPTGEGTGLGLSTAYGIMKQMSGFIFVDSEPGHGAVFSLYLPIAEKLVLPETPPKRPSPPKGRARGVVLLVEDEAPVRAFAARALRLRGFTVLEAECAERALEMLEDPDIGIDVFVSDVIMPGLDGPTWVKQALEQRPGARVVFMSGYAEEAVTETQARIAGSVFLQKPFSLDQLVQTVQGQVDVIAPD